MANLKRYGKGKVGRLGHGQRMVKMVQPICLVRDDKGEVIGGCQNQADVPRDWFETCPHNPYFSVKERVVRERIVEEEDGVKVVKGYSEKILVEESPNLTQVALSIRVNSGQGIEKKQALGFKLPEEIGIAPFCQYLDCWSQDITVRDYKYGDYCDETQARMVAIDYSGKPLEVLVPEKREAQLAAISVGRV